MNSVRRLAKTAAYTVLPTDIGSTICLAGNAFYALTFGAASTYDPIFVVTVINEDAGRAKNVVLNGVTLKLWPGQWVTITNQANVWRYTTIERWRPNAALVLWVRTDGSDTTSDGLDDSAGGAFATIQKAFNELAQKIEIDPQGDVQVKCGDGEFTSGLHWTSSPPGGEGGARITLRGKNNTGTIINTVGTAIGVFHDAILTLAKLELKTSGSGDCISASIGAFVYLMDNMKFGACAGNHVTSNADATVQCTNETITLTGGAPAGAHLSSVGGGSRILFSGVTRVLAASVSFFATVICGQNSTLTDTSGVWTLGGFTVTGSRFFIASRGQIITGTNDFNFYPGSSAGQVFSSGTYDDFEFDNAEITVASAATCNILGAPSEKILISGTATITSFGVGPNVRRWVRVTGVLTLTHTAGVLILPGGANIVTAGNDCFVVQSDGNSNCRVVNYQRNIAP